MDPPISKISPMVDPAMSTNGLKQNMLAQTRRDEKQALLTQKYPSFRKHLRPKSESFPD